MSDNGKGSTRRPRLVSEEIYSRNFEATFKKCNKKNCNSCNCNKKEKSKETSKIDESDDKS